MLALKRNPVQTHMFKDPIGVFIHSLKMKKNVEIKGERNNKLKL